MSWSDNEECPKVSESLSGIFALMVSFSITLLEKQKSVILGISTRL